MRKREKNADLPAISLATFPSAVVVDDRLRDTVSAISVLSRMVVAEREADATHIADVWEASQSASIA